MLTLKGVGHEGYHLMLKGRLDLENFSGRTVPAVPQDFHAAVFLRNLESLLTQPVQSAWAERPTAEDYPTEAGATEERPYSSIAPTEPSPLSLCRRALP